MRTGISHVPLHGGHCPPWLFEKMKLLGSAILNVIVLEYGSAEVLRRLSDPVWFQTFGCVLGFDWHSSGLTTVLCGALKEGTKDLQREWGLFFAGGKGRVSRQTPLEIDDIGDKFGLNNDLAVLKRSSRLVAKVDSAAVQDGYQLYHHVFIFDQQGNWAVVQQGMNENMRYARRYHWLSEQLKSYTEEPHAGVCGMPEDNVLNLVAHQNMQTRKASVELCREKPENVIRALRQLSPSKNSSPNTTQVSFWDEKPREIYLPAYHAIPRSAYLDKALYRLYEKPPEEYESLLETSGVGAGTLRALAMVAEVTHGVKPTFSDPVRYTFAHGGKDGFPFPVQRRDYDESINVLETTIKKAKIGYTDKLQALRKLAGIDKSGHNGIVPLK